MTFWDSQPMGEFELLALLRERLPEPGPRVRLGSGDDAAVSVPGGAVATSVDALVEGVHFRRETASLRQIGRKALSTALSDLAAMGAEPGEAYVVLGAPEEIGRGGAAGARRGTGRGRRETGTTLAGGDLTRAPALTLAVTVVGHAARPEDFVTRAGARPGDVLVVDRRARRRGGRAAAARGRGWCAAARAADDGALRARQLDPTPRLAAGRALAAAGATAMIDISDGLAGDAGHVATASGALLAIDAERPADRRRASPRSPPRPDRDPLELAASRRRGLRAAGRAPARRRRRRPRGARRRRARR